MEIMDIIRLGRPRGIRCKEDLLHTMSPYDPQKLFIRDLGKAGCRIEPYVFTNQKFLYLTPSLETAHMSKNELLWTHLMNHVPDYGWSGVDEIRISRICL